MKKSAIFKQLAILGLNFVPGGNAIQALATKDDDPTNDVDEIATHIADAVIKVMAAAEGITERDLINEPAVLALKANIVSSIQLVPVVLVRPAVSTGA